MSLIEKNVPERASFEELQRRAEAEAGTPPDSELYAEFGEQAPLPDAPEVEAEEAPEEPETVEAVEEPDTQASEPEPEKPDQAEADKKKLGQVLNENAELRRRLEALEQAQSEPPQQQYPLTQDTLVAFDEYAAENPAQAVSLAIQQQSGLLYDRALRVWYEQDPVAAGRFERQAELAQMQQTLEKQFQPQIQSAQNLVQNRELEQALDAVAGRHEDFAQVIGTLNDERVQEIIDSGMPPELARGLTGDQKSKEAVIETLYRWVKAEQSGTFATAATEAAQKAAEETRQAKVDATVASASTTTPEPVPESEEQRMVKAWNTRPSMRDAWDNRGASRV